MGSIVDPRTICKLCCNIFEPETLYLIPDTSIVITDGQDPEPMLPIINSLFSVKVDPADLLQCVCIDCINAITGWKVYLEKCFQAQQSLPEDLRLHQCETTPEEDADGVCESQTDIMSEVPSEVPNPQRDLPNDLKEVSANVREKQIESSASRVQKVNKEKPSKPKPLSRKSKDLQEQIKNESGIKDSPVKDCAVVLKRMKDAGEVIPNHAINSLYIVDVKLEREDGTGKPSNESESEEQSSDTPVHPKSRGRPKSKKPLEVDPLAEPTERTPKKKGRPRKSSVTEPPTPKVEPEPTQSRSKRTPKPKQIFDPSVISNKMGQFTNLDSQPPPKKKARISQSTVVDLAGLKVDEEEVGRHENNEEAGDGGEYTVQIDMDDAEHEEPEDTNTTSYVFITADDGSVELIPDEGSEDTTVFLNGNYREPEDEEFEEKPKKKVIRKHHPPIESVVGEDSGVRPRKLLGDQWYGVEFTMEFLESAIGRTLDERELESLSSLIRRRRFREAWVASFIGSIKGIPALKHRVCNICDETIKGSTKDFEKHTKSEHGCPPVFVCEWCEEEVEGNDEYYDHWEDHLQHFACRGCKFYFGSREDRDIHKQSPEHMERQRRAGEAKGEGKRKSLGPIPVRSAKHEGMQQECPTCGLEFSSRLDLKEHTTLQHSEKNKRIVDIDELVNDLSKETTAKEDDNTGDEEDSTTIHSCSECGKQFDNLRKLSIHLCEVHNRVRGPLLCEFCEISFENEIESKRHRAKFHYGQGEACKLCKKWISTKKALESHMKRHLGVDNKSFPCFQCSKAFATEEALKMHESSVHGQQSCFECALCSLRFSRRKECLNHIGEHGDFDNHAQFVQEVPLLEEEQEDSLGGTEMYFCDEESSFLLEEPMIL